MYKNISRQNVSLFFWSFFFCMSEQVNLSSAQTSFGSDLLIFLLYPDIVLFK